jgi:hypothetical protein
MRNLAKKQEYRQEVFQELATVVGIAGRTVAVRTEAGELELQRAASCLLQPAAGDLVLIAVTPAGQGFVLAVLERLEGTPSTITLDGNLDIKLPNGRLGFAAQEGVSVASGKDVSVVSGAVQVRAVEGNVALQSFTFLSTLFRAELEKAKVLGASLDTLFERLSQRVKRSYRVVEESDQLRAERIDHVAKGTMSLRGANTLITAEELVKVDGAQIHLG